MSWDPLAEEEEPQPQTRLTLENARFPGGKLEIVLEKAGELGISSAEDYIARMVTLYVTGDEIEKTTPILFIHKGRQYRLNRPLIRNIAYILAMQKQEPKYDFAFYLGLAKNFSDDFGRIRRAAWNLLEPERPKPGEESLNPFDFPDNASEDGSFAALSTSDNGIPTSKSARTKHSAALPTP